MLQNPRNPFIMIKWKNNYEYEALVDTGSTRCLMSCFMLKKIFQNKNIMSTLYNCDLCIRAANGTFLKILGQKIIEFTIKSENHIQKFLHNFIIFDSFSQEILLGMDFLYENNVVVFPHIGLYVSVQEASAENCKAASI